MARSRGSHYSLSFQETGRPFVFYTFLDSIGGGENNNGEEGARSGNKERGVKLFYELSSLFYPAGLKGQAQGGGFEVSVLLAPSKLHIIQTLFAITVSIFELGTPVIAPAASI